MIKTKGNPNYEIIPPSLINPLRGFTHPPKRLCRYVVSLHDWLKCGSYMQVMDPTTYTLHSMMR